MYTYPYVWYYSAPYLLIRTYTVCNVDTLYLFIVFNLLGVVGKGQSRLERLW